MKHLSLLLLLFTVFSFAVTIESDTNKTDLTAAPVSKSFFGSKLFQGSFKENKQAIYNPNYLVNIGDEVAVKLWGAFEYEKSLTVDAKGYIFLPKVGTVHLLGINYKELQPKIEKAVKKVFNQNVQVYASLNAYQPVSVFVSGSVSKPGLYEGMSLDSVLQWIDKAEGIIDGQGSYRRISIQRNNQYIKEVDLYDFLLNGDLDLFQFKSGDVVMVNTLQSYVKVRGDVRRSFSFELQGKSASVQTVMDYSLPLPNVTHFMLTHWVENHQKVDKYAIADASRVEIKHGESLMFLRDHIVDTVTVNIEGEHANFHTVALPVGANLETLLNSIITTPLSDKESVQLFRKSVAKKQKQLISANLKELEARILTTGSSTTEEAKIRGEEAKLVLDFISRATAVEPKGQVTLNKKSDLSLLTLEEGDTIFIPKKSQIVVVEGEVVLPNALTYVAGYSMNDYINLCGGYGERANEEKVLLVKKNGRVFTNNDSSFFGKTHYDVEPGDSILVLGKVDSKSIQVTSSVTQILYQIAVGAAVVLKAF